MTVEIDKLKTLIEYIGRNVSEGEFWIDTYVDRTLHSQLGPFASRAEREAALVDLQSMMRELGAVDLPTLPQ